MTKGETADVGLGGMGASVRVDFGPIEMRPPTELRAAARNARKHPEKQLVKLAASIERFGLTHPVLVTRESEIVAGHAVVQAAIKLGLPLIPTIVLSGMSPLQIRQYRLADNRLGDLSSFDMTLLSEELREIVELETVECVEMMGWDIAEAEIIIDDAGSGTEDPDDVAPPLAAVAVSRLGDLWQLDGHRLVCGSSLDADVWARLMGGDKASMSFTDAPFNVPIAGHVCGLGKVQHEAFAFASGEMSEEQFTDFNTTWLRGVSEHLEEGGIIAAVMDWRHIYELQTAARRVRLGLINLCIWNKTNGGMGSLYRSKHEMVLILKKGQGRHINNVQLGRHGRYRTNVWDYAGVNSFGATRMADLASHPTVKPIALVADCIRDVSHRGQIVVDAFMGSGTTLLAAERTGRRGYGIEIEPRYVDLAIRRWQDMTGGEARLVDDGRSFVQIAAARCETPAAEAA